MIDNLSLPEESPSHAVSFIPESPGMMPDLVQLQVLDSLLRESSLTRSAERLGLSQPSVSRILARLRRHFGDPLFVRIGQRMEPTARALELAEPVAAVLAGVRQLQGGPAHFDPATTDRCFRLTMVEGGVADVLPKLLHHLETAAPGVSLRTVRCDTHELAYALEQGRVELALGSFPGLAGSIRQREFAREPYATLMRAGHPCIGRLDRDAFLAQRHVLVDMDDTGHDYASTVRTLESLLAPGKVLCRVHGFTAAAHIVRHTDALMTLPQRLAHALGDDLGLVVAEVPLALPSLPLLLYWHERSHRDPANRWLRDAVRSVMCGRAPQDEAIRSED
jgi:DNA-binding transcriptional LysR family regulator